MILVVHCWGDKSQKCFNYFLNVDNSTLDTEGNACVIIAIPVIESTFENDYIHILHGLSKEYMYVYLISKLISSKVAFQGLIWKTICLLLVYVLAGKDTI